MSADLSSLYGVQPLILWVEDEATRLALSTAWAGDAVAIYVGGSNETIRATAEHAWRAGISHVFGVVDRDFGRSNVKEWAAPPNGLRTYVLASPEVENFVLDPASIAECAYNTAGVSEAEVAAASIIVLPKLRAMLRHLRHSSSPWTSSLSQTLTRPIRKPTSPTAF